MKKFIFVLLIFILPLLIYLFSDDEIPEQSAVADNGKNPTLMTFTSAMCSDCKRLKTVLKDVEPEYASRVNFVKINALDNSRQVQNSLRQYNVVLVPTMVFLDRNGNTKNKIEGYIPKRELEAELERLIND